MNTVQRCARCDAENREGRRFCGTCGAALPRACPTCGFPNEVGEGFCGGCGVALAPPSTPSPARPSPDAQHQELGERRQVTILFADLSGFTSLAAQRDPEETHRMLGRFFEAVDRIVTRFGGAIERHIGDNVMGVFGAPLAHGDDPYRAVRTAAEIHAAVRAVGADLGIELSVHIGIAAGTVMASSTGSTLKAAYGVVGTPVNLAARLQGLAAAGETLVSSAVKDAVDHLVEFETRGDVTIKGLSTPVAVWRMSGERLDRDAIAATPLVGRRSEIRLLSSLLDDVVECGHGRAVCVRGEAGIGKTRLMQALTEMGRERDFSCHAALVLDFGTGQGRDAMRALVASLIGSKPLANEAERRASAAGAVRHGLVAADDAGFLADLLDLPQPSELRALYDAMDNGVRVLGKRRVAAGLVLAVSATTPVLLLVEDLHWADAPTLENLAVVMDAAQQRPIVLAMTSRIEGDPLDDAWRGRVRGGITTIDLGPLRAVEASEFGLRLRIANDPFLQRCIDRAEGNPLFLEQLLRNTEEGAETDEVPATVQSLVLARMDRLTPRDKAALQAASTGGQRFPLDLVRALTRDPGYVPTTLLRHQMIRPEGAEYLFAHALVRDGVYSSLTHERRRTLHRAAADWYSERDPVLCAEHLERANDLRAPHAYHSAAQAEAADYHYDRALSLAERGRAIATSAADCFGLDGLRGDILRETGRAPESLQAWERALTEAGNAAEQCRAHIGIAAADRILSRLEPALAALAEAQSRAGEQTLERAQIHYYRGNILFAKGDTEGCLAEHRAALSNAEAVRADEWRARASSGIGDALYMSCRMRTALAAFQNCVGLCDAAGYGRVALPNRLMMGHCMIYLQRADEAIALVVEAGKLASRAGAPNAEMFAAQSRGMVLVQSGRLGEAKDHILAALERTRALGARRYEASALILQAEFTLHEGRRADALNFARQAVAISREVGLGFVGPTALAMLARASDDPSLRAAALAEGESVLRSGCVGHNRIWYYRAAGEAYLEVEDWPEADRCADRLLAVTSSEPLPLAQFIAARLRILSAAGRGEHGSGLCAEADRLSAECAAKGHHDWLPALKRARTALVHADANLST